MLTYSQPQKTNQKSIAEKSFSINSRNNSRNISKFTAVRNSPDNIWHSRPGQNNSISSTQNCQSDFQKLSSRPARGIELLDQQTGTTAETTTPNGTPTAVTVPQVELKEEPAIKFNPRIRASTTPENMVPDRIPPRKDFAVNVSMSGYSIPMSPVKLSVDGSGGNNGTVTVDGALSKEIFSNSVTVQLHGTTQTDPGRAGNLKLAARWNNQLLALSNCFSVAAIPQDMALSSFTELTGDDRGFVVTQTWVSDSGNLGDLNQAEVSEAVQYTSSTGMFSGLGANNSGYLAASGGSLTDTHGTPVKAITAPGTCDANQTEMFLDKRTGVTDVPMRNSGFTIGRVVITKTPASGPSYLEITTSKQGASVTANGISSNAGSGKISLPQKV